MPFPKRLIVNADDFGLHCSINAAIQSAHVAGIVTSTSLMAGSELAPAFDHAIALCRSLPTLDVGLHFTLVGAPGLPNSHSDFIKAKAAGQFPSSRITGMLHKQLDTLMYHGIAPTHIDSHQHLHALPSIMKVVAAVAKEYGIKAVRLPLETGNYIGASKGRVVQSKALSLLCKVSRATLIRSGLKFPDYFIGMAVSGALNPIVMLDILKSLSPGTTEILCHPALSNQELSTAYPWGYNWESELKAVTDAGVLNCIKELDVKLVSYKSLAISSPETL